MCWQCVTRPSVYLKELGGMFNHIGWHFGEGCGEGVLEFTIDGERWHTNPVADIDFIGESLPGDTDPDGIPYFLKGEFIAPKNSRYQSSFWYNRQD